MKQTTPPSDIKPIHARAYIPSMAMRQAAERAKFQPRLTTMTSNVSNFRHMEG